MIAEPFCTNLVGTVLCFLRTVFQWFTGAAYVIFLSLLSSSAITGPLLGIYVTADGFVVTVTHSFVCCCPSLPETDWFIEAGKTHGEAALPDPVKSRVVVLDTPGMICFAALDTPIIVRFGEDFLYAPVMPRFVVLVVLDASVTPA